MQIYLLLRLVPEEQLVEVFFDEDKAIQELDKLQKVVGHMGACLDIVDTEDEMHL